MDAIARESARSLDLRNEIVYLPTRKFHSLHPKVLFSRQKLKRASTILFLHHRTFFRLHSKYPSKVSRVYIAHFDEGESLHVDEVKKLNSAQRIIFQSKATRDLALNFGVDPRKCLVRHGGISKSDFYPSSRLLRDSYVLIAGECKPRKNPQLIKEVIKLNPKTQFIIHGNGWLEYFKNDFYQNLTILPFVFKQHPQLMREASVLLTLSSIEGGPFTILEALASGTPVVSTPVGISEEILSSETGVILTRSPKILEISNAISQAFELKPRIFNRSVLPHGHDWETFGEALYLL